jgi:hypothetical protein
MMPIVSILALAKGGALTRAKASGVHRGRPPAFKPVNQEKKKASDYET